MRELGGMAEEVEQTIQKETHGIVETLKNLPTPEARTEKIKYLTGIFKEYLKHGEDKVALAVQTYDMVDRHIRRLDDDLAKYEDEQMTGPRAHQQYYTPIATEMLLDKRGATAANDTPNKRKFASKPNKPSTPQPETAPSNNTIKKDTKRVPAATSYPATSTAASNKGKNVASKAVVEIQPVPQLKGSPDDLPIDPNEPRYCICNQYSFGDMIGCDNSDVSYFYL
ncbi:UNVERIFIED_CONTAM: Inhibitor of growth protein 5 [Siphonaria sp. JEL0065]|nr:Inhibitor of growth protein 5 [Siphonaria sp. JEL0065]